MHAIVLSHTAAMFSHDRKTFVWSGSKRGLGYVWGFKPTVLFNMAAGRERSIKLKNDPGYIKIVMIPEENILVF